VRGRRHARQHLTPGKDPVPIVQEAGWAPGPVWTGAENLAPPGFDPRTVQPVGSRYTDYGTQPTSGPEGSRKVRFPDVMTTAQDGGKFVSLTHRPPLSQEIHLYSFLLEAESNPGLQCDREDYVTDKIPMTPWGIEPATCRFVAECLNHYATARPKP
jgi:hypothetical protein